MCKFYLINIFLCISLVTKSQQTNKPIYVTRLSENIGNFSLSFLYHTTSYVGDHAVISPFTVWAMMAQLAEGAKGETLRELRETLGLFADASKVQLGYKEILKNVTLNTPTVKIERFSGMFFDKSLKIYPSYTNLMANLYKASVVSMDFGDSLMSSKRINNLISQVTHGLIPETIFSTDLINARSIIANAVYFKGQWEVPFNTSNTATEPFYNEDGFKIGNVRMMYNIMPYPYVNLKPLKAHVIEIPYGNDDRVSMLVILPYPGISVKSMFLQFRRMPLSQVFQQLSEASDMYDDDLIECWLPRFRISTDLVLNKPLNDVGVFEIFDPAYSDLSFISKEPLYISKVIHKARIEVVEEGTTAAAVTAAELENRIPPPKFKANRPFVFMIIEKSVNVIIFGGVYSRPSLF